MPDPAIAEKPELRGTALSRYLDQCAVFARGFAAQPRMVGSIIPSSRFTIRRMFEPIDFARCDLFVEYGPGVGTFTLPALERMRPDATLIAIDTNALYVDYLKRTVADPRLKPVHASAADVERIVAEAGFERADYILSGLPFSTLPEGVGPGIVEATHRALRPGGAFCVYQFSAAAKRLMEPRFERVDEAFEPLNVLPCKLFWGWR